MIWSWCGHVKCTKTTTHPYSAAPWLNQAWKTLATPSLDPDLWCYQNWNETIHLAAKKPQQNWTLWSHTMWTFLLSLWYDCKHGIYLTARDLFGACAVGQWHWTSTLTPWKPINHKYSKVNYLFLESNLTGICHFCSACYVKTLSP